MSLIWPRLWFCRFCLEMVHCAKLLVVFPIKLQVRHIKIPWKVENCCLFENIIWPPSTRCKGFLIKGPNPNISIFSVSSEVNYICYGFRMKYKIGMKLKPKNKHKVNIRTSKKSDSNVQTDNCSTQFEFLCSTRFGTLWRLYFVKILQHFLYSIFYNL